MAEKKMLVLRLEGVLQAWDSSSKWNDRSTEDFPSKSGVVGLLGCAMGMKRCESALTALSDACVMAVRADRKGERVRDFQTVTGSPLRTAEGKPKIGGNTIISNRDYLQDACFTVFLETNKEWHKRIVAALKAPKWCLYLGRKSCVPSRPVLECEDAHYDSLEKALRGYPPAPRAEYPMPFETELQDDTLPSFTRPDALIDSNRGFTRRRVWRGVLKEEDHDPNED